TLNPQGTTEAALVVAAALARLAAARVSLEAVPRLAARTEAMLAPAEVRVRAAMLAPAVVRVRAAVLAPAVVRVRAAALVRLVPAACGSQRLAPAGSGS